MPVVNLSVGAMKISLLMPSLQWWVAATSRKRMLGSRARMRAKPFSSRGQTLVCLLPFAIEGVVCVSLVFICAFRVESGPIVRRERQVLLDPPDEIRVGDPVPPESDHDVGVPLGGIVSGICGEPAGKEERSRSPNIVLTKVAARSAKARSASCESTESELMAHDKVQILALRYIDNLVPCL